MATLPWMVWGRALLPVQRAQLASCRRLPKRRTDRRDGNVDCHSEPTFFAQWGIWASRAMRCVRCDAILARLATRISHNDMQLLLPALVDLSSSPAGCPLVGVSSRCGSAAFELRGVRSGITHDPQGWNC